jgi:periplasmic protein TonB
MAYPLQQREGLRGTIKTIPPLFWFGVVSLLFHLCLLLLWTRPSLSFKVSAGNLPVHVEIMGQVAAAQSSQPVSSSPNQPPLAKSIAPDWPQQTAQPERIAVPPPSPAPTPKMSVQHKPAVQTVEAKPEPEKPIRSAKRSPSPVMPSSPLAEPPAVLASAATQIESPLASKPKAQDASTDSVSKTATRTGVDQPVNTNIANAKLDEDAEAATADRLKLHIREALATHFRYPLIARKRGWQGEVLLSFDVDSDGRISHVQVSRSSGYRALDEAALRALDQVGRVEQAPLVRVSLQLPVTYQLKS